MKLSACITLNSRPLPVINSVFSSMREQDHDEFVIVLDRTPPELADHCREWWKDDPRTRLVELAGEPGWKSPVKAWNAGFAALTGDALYCFSSETLQAAGNLKTARRLLEEQEAVYFGKAECSCGPSGQEVNWLGTAPGNLLCDAAHPRPLGFIWWAPTRLIRQVKGFDEEFYSGYWWDENDLFTRIWRTGADFVFDDLVHGIHMHHDRPVLATPEGQAGIARNRGYMLSKYGSLDPMGQVLKMSESRPGRTIWRHL